MGVAAEVSEGVFDISRLYYNLNETWTIFF